MILISKKKKKNKSIISKLNNFLFFYFIVSILTVTIIIIFVVNSYSYQKLQSKYLDYFSKAGRYEYLYLPQIIYKSLKSNFYQIDKLDLQVSFENSLVIENLRKESIEKGELPSAINIPRVKVKIFHNNENVRSDMRLKGDRMVHFQEKKKLFL